MASVAMLSVEVPAGCTGRIVDARSGGWTGRGKNRRKCRPTIDYVVEGLLIFPGDVELDPARPDCVRWAPACLTRFEAIGIDLDEEASADPTDFQEIREATQLSLARSTSVGNSGSQT